MANHTVDPFHQTFSFVIGDGTPLTITMDDLNDHVQYNVQICINYASQLGACLMLFVVLLLLTKPEKRLSPVFLLNTVSLFINVCRMFCMIIYFTTAWSNQYAYFAQDYSRVPRADYATSIAGVVLTLLLLISVQTSLILQSQVVCTTLRPLYRRALLVASLVVALVAIGFRLAVVVTASEFILGATNYTPFVWLQSATIIAITTSICFFCAVFVTKLAFAIHQRRALGLKQFGPMQIIFIMGCQTMFVPVIFCILQYYTNVPEFGSLVLTTVAIFLPLSSVWAAAAVDHASQEHTTTTIRKKLFGTWNSGAAATYDSRKLSGNTLNPAQSVSTRISNSPMPSPSSIDTTNVDKDLEKAGIRVDHMFGVSSKRNGSLV